MVYGVFLKMDEVEDDIDWCFVCCCFVFDLFVNL